MISRSFVLSENIASQKEEKLSSKHQFTSSFALSVRKHVAEVHPLLQSHTAFTPQSPPKKKKTTTTLPEIPPAGLYFDQKLGLPDKLKPCKKELAKSILRTWSHWRQSFAPENWWLERWSFPFLAISTYFQGQKVGFKECNAVEGFWFMAWGPHVGMFFLNRTNLEFLSGDCP